MTWKYIFDCLLHNCLKLAIACFLLASLPVAAKKPDSAFSPDVWKMEEELKAEAESGDDTKKVQLYMRLARIFKDNERELQYLDAAETSAASLKSIQDLGTISLMRLEHCSLYGEHEEFSKAAAQAKEFMTLHKDIRLANVEHITIKRSIDEGHIQTALDAADKMLGQATQQQNRYREAYAYFSIGLIYLAVNQEEESINALKKSINLMEMDKSQFPLIDIIKARLELISAQSTLGRNLESLETCRATEKLLQEYIDENDAVFQAEANCKSMGLYIQSYYILNYVAMKEYASASQHIKLAKEYVYPMIGLDLEVFNEACANYYLAIGDYKQALEHIEHSVDAFHGEDLLPYYLDALELKTRILAGMGQWEDAYSCQANVTRMRDSLDASRSAMRISELHAIYEIDKVEAQRDRQQTIILFSTMICILLLITIVIFAIYSDRLKKKNKTLYEQIASSVISSKKMASALKMTPEDNLSKEMQIFRRITLLMEDGHPFTDLSFNRTQMAQMLGTNEKYIADAIREGAGATIASYITDTRLEYSLSLLDDDNDYTLDDIARESGFGSYSSFFRAFQKKYSITPSDYRKSRNRSNAITH